MPLRPILVLLLTLGAQAAEDLIRDGTFAEGLAHWSDAANDADRTAEVVALDGASALRLSRLTPGAEVAVQQYNVRLAPRTVYRLSVAGHGSLDGVVKLGPSSSSDPDYAAHSKAWATATGPLPASTAIAVETLLFDSGNLVDGAYLSLRLGGDGPGWYAFTRVALEKVAPSPDELIVAHLGDSITITSYLPFSQRIDALLAEPLAAASGARPVRQINLGADGETVAEMLAGRYDHAVRAMYPRIDVAVIRYGANDRRSRDPAAFAADLATLCDHLTADHPGVRIVLGTGPWLLGDDEANLRQYGPWWQAIRDLAAERRYALADVAAAFAAAATADTARAPGDLHPSAAGVAVACAELARIIAPLLPG
ncbi:MAG: SGNH/GDSL hydrolase family protein, partial [Planctomycetes bacterium]|nr:SGNH/GDSL hydrolase family protein [Planctomycetota bacterium]